MQTPQTTTGDEIRKARVSAGLTQVELAGYMAVGQSFVAHLETNRTRPSDIHLRDILAAWNANNCDKSRACFWLTIDGWQFEPGK